MRILEAIRRYGPISRADVAVRLGITRGIVTRWVKVLTARGFLRETGIVASRGGRPPRLVELNNVAARIACVDIDFPTVEVGLADLSCAILKTRRFSFASKETSARILRRVVEELQEITQGVRAADRKGVGVSASARIDREAGVILTSSSLPHWRDVPVVAAIEEAVGAPTFLDHNVNLLALAESLHGCGRGREFGPLLCVNIGAGIGMGLIIGGRIYRGASSRVARELGHLIIRRNGPICECGRRGCIEACVSALPLLRRHRAEALTDINAMLRRAPRQAETGLQKIGEMVGLGVAHAMTLLTPQAVIVSGRLLDDRDLLWNALTDTVARSAHPLAVETASLLKGSLGEAARLVGAGAMVVSEMVRRLSLKLPLR